VAKKDSPGAIVDRKDVNQQQLVELITTGRTGNAGLATQRDRGDGVT